MVVAIKTQEILENKNVKTKDDLFLSGIKDFDLAVDGIAPGEIMIVSAPPAVGKTAFCLTYALNSAKKNIKVLYLTSSPKGYLTNRIAKVDVDATINVEYVEGIEIEGNKVPGIDEEIPGEMEKIIEYYAVQEPAEEIKDMDPMEMYTRDLPPWLLIIDSIDYVYKYYPKQGNYEEVRCELLKKYLKGIKRLAKKFNAAVIITANALDSGETAELSREVATCAPLAEVICLLDRDKEDSQRVVLEMLKNVKRGSGLLTLGIDEKTKMLKDYP